MKFGDTVTVKGTLYRTCERRQRKQYSGLERPQPYKLWKEREIKPRQAILIGFRTLQNGFKYWEPEVGWIFAGDEQVKAVLVVFNERERPVFALPSSVQPTT